MNSTALRSTNAPATSRKPIRGRPFSGRDDPRRGPGFTGADDPRRNNNGQRNRAAVAFTKQLREMLVEEGLRRVDGIPRIGRVIARLYDAAEAGEGWAVALLFDRVEGKVTQPVEQNSDVSVLVIRGASLDEL
jgi:hypothetical protein